MTATMLMKIDNMIWDRLNAGDGGAIAAQWQKYLAHVASQTYGVRASAACMDKLENENYHSLCGALVQLDRVSPRAKNWYRHPYMMKMNGGVAA